MNTAAKSELRKFGLSVGGTFLLLALISWLRGHEFAPLVLCVLGTLLVLPGAIAPAVLGPVYRGWMKAAAALGHVNTRILLTTFYYIGLTPGGLLLRLVRDPLNLSAKGSGASAWVRRPPETLDPKRYERQF